MKRVEFDVDGERLVGDLHLPVARSTRGSPLVVLAHGLSSSRVEWYGVPAAIARAGFAVFSFDFRGHGESQGERGVQGLERATKDLAAAAAAAAKDARVDAKRLAVIGHSLGATLALGAAPSLGLRALVALAPPHLLKLEMGAAEHVGYRALHTLNQPLLLLSKRGLRVPYKVSYARLYEDPAAVQRAQHDDFLQRTVPIKNYTTLVRGLDGEAWARRAKVPTLVVVATKDRVVRNTSSRTVYEALPGPKRIVELKGSGHSMPGDHRCEELVEHVTEFLAEHLKGAAA